jgi:PAS domain S-box-containing protein
MTKPARLTLRWLLTFVGIFAAGAIGFRLPSVYPHPTMPILTTGVALAACIRWGRVMWPAIFLASVCVELWIHMTFLVSLGVSLGLTLGTLVTWRLLQLCNFDPSFSRARDVPLFLILAALGTAIEPTLGLISIALATDKTAFPDGIRWVRWWGNAAAGVVMVGPMLVAVSRQSVEAFLARRLEGALWFLAIILCGGLLLALGPDGGMRALMIGLSILAIVVGAMRFGLVASCFAAFLLCVAAALGYALNQGVFTQFSDTSTGLATVWMYGAIISGLSLIITALLDERDRAALERLLAEQRYAQIFDGSPQAIWVQDPGTKRVLLVNEAALRQYGYGREEFLLLKATALAAGNAPVLPSPEESVPEPFETLHQAKDGRTLAVEVWVRLIDLGTQKAELVFACDVTDRRALGSALIDAVGNEQRRLGLELHDGLGQELTGAALSAHALVARAKREEQHDMAHQLEEHANLIRACVQSARRIAHGVSPLSEAEGSLPRALEDLAASSSLAGTAVHFRGQIEAPITLDQDVRDHLYRIAQEGTQNALKHAKAENIEILLWVAPTLVRLEVNDDGVGMPAQAAQGHGIGMRTLRFRASSIGAKLAVQNRETGGVSIACEVLQPLRSAERMRA